MDFLHRTWAEIDLKALEHNFKILKDKAKSCKVMAVVKADAYGHSVAAVAPVLAKNGADFFAVSNIDEALALRNLGLGEPILILGYTPVNKAAELAHNNLSQCVYSREYAEDLSHFAKLNNIKIKVHIKLDTGMSRIGFDCRNDSLCGITDAIKAAENESFLVEGVFTHFAVSDRTEKTEDGFTNEQFGRFTKAVDALKNAGVCIPLVHSANSAAFLQDDDKHLSLSRVGIALYGLSPASDLELKEDLIPVMTVKSVVSMVKEINEGDTVSYGRTFKAERKMKIATISAGYADGYPRTLSNKGFVLIGGQKANIMGRICMDQMCVDVSDIRDVKMGDEVILFGKDLKVDTLADLAGTINYEIICGISPRVPRIVKKG